MYLVIECFFFKQQLPISGRVPEAKPKRAEGLGGDRGGDRFRFHTARVRPRAEEGRKGLGRDTREPGRVPEIDRGLHAAHR